MSAISVLLFFVGIWAGVQNALAGGGSFITFPVLLLAGLDPRAANITSSVALFPASLVASFSGRGLVRGVDHLSFRSLLVISLIGGALGGLLLLGTPPTFFAALVPWLVLFATAVFAWGSFRPKALLHPSAAVRRHPAGAAIAQFAIAIYGGYFGGGIGFLMLAVLTMAGQAVRHAGATKNALASAMNGSAFLIFALSPDTHWPEAGLLCAGAALGGFLGVWLLDRANEKLLRGIIVGIGIALTVGLFLKR